VNCILAEEVTAFDIKWRHNLEGNILTLAIAKISNLPNVVVPYVISLPQVTHFWCTNSILWLRKWQSCQILWMRVNRDFLININTNYRALLYMSKFRKTCGNLSLYSFITITPSPSPIMAISLTTLTWRYKISADDSAWQNDQETTNNSKKIQSSNFLVSRTSPRDI
jgi:hypothetical protein